jgi:hypothetical protein
MFKRIQARNVDDARIRKEQDEAWKRDQKYKDEQIKQDVIGLALRAVCRFFLDI